MKITLINKTLPARWWFELDHAPAFPGIHHASSTDADRLLIGGFLDSRYEREDLFFVSKRYWIKRFSGAHASRDIFIQVTIDQAVIWLFKNGFIEDHTEVDFDELMKKSCRLTFDFDDSELMKRIERRKQINNDSMYPSSFMEK